MGETTESKKGTPPVTGQSSEGKGGSTSQETPETYTKEQTQKLVSDALAEQGRKHKAELDPIVTERDTLKVQIQTKDIAIEDIGNEIKKLQTEIDELAGDDPEKKNLVKKARELREQEQKLKTERTTLDADKQVHQEQITLATNTLREISIWEISAEYEGSDPVKLKALCDKGKVTSEEDIREFADTLWTKKPVTPAKSVTPPIKADSGTTIGGSENWEDVRAAYIKNPNNPAIYKRYMEMRKERQK